VSKKFVKSLVFLLFFGVLFSQDDQNNLPPPEVLPKTSKVGTAAAVFLKIPVGSRESGMGGAFVALAEGPTSMFWNPAGLASSKDFQLSLMQNQWIVELSHLFAGVSFPFAKGGIGLSVISLASDPVEITTVEEPSGTGYYYNYSDLAVGLSYGRNLTDRFSVGSTIKIIQEKIYHESAHSVAIDIGSILRTNFYGFRIGMNLSNFGTDMRFTGRDLDVPYRRTLGLGEEESPAYEVQASLNTIYWRIPTNFSFGVATDILSLKESEDEKGESDSKLWLSAVGNYPNDGDFGFRLGSEFDFRQLFFIRAGYRLEEYRSYPTFGFGINVSGVNVDYSYADLGVFNSVNMFTVLIDF
jgi:hypothetical protein